MATEGSVYTLLTVLFTVCGAAHAYLGTRQEEEEEEGESSGSGSGGGSEGPPLSTEAIANITASAVALVVLSSAMCYLLMCFNKEERMQRVRMAQERNRQIVQQLEAAKQKKRAQEKASGGGSQSGSSREEERHSAGNLLFSQSHHSHQEGSRETENNPLVSPPPSKSLT